MNSFICDFIQDQSGRFQFLKIHEYETDGKLMNDHNWKLSTFYKKEQE